MTEFTPAPLDLRISPQATIWLSELVKRISPATTSKYGTVRQATDTELGAVKQAAAVSDSTAATVSDLKGDLNALLAALRAAGVVKES